MKKLILLIAALGTFGFANAQEGLHVGVQGGYYLVGMIGGPSTVKPGDPGYVATVKNPFTRFSAKFAGKFGIEAGYGIIGILGVQAELNFASLGQLSTTSAGGVERDINLNYVEIPLLIKLRTPGEMMHYYFMAGPQFNFLTSASIIDGKVSSIADAKSHFNSSDVGLMFDTGMEIDITKLFFNIGFRAYYGLTDPNIAGYQLENSSGAYTTSHNFSGGINIGIHYKI